MLKLYSLFLVIIFSIPAAASLPQPTEGPNFINQSRTFTGWHIGRWYTLQKAVALGRYDRFTPKINVPAGLDFTILDISDDGDFAKIAFNDEASEHTSRLPDEMIVALQDLEAGDPLMIVFENMNPNFLDGIPSVNIEDLDRLLLELQLSRRGRGHHRHHHSMTYCIADVRIFARRHCGMKMPRVSPARKGYAVYRKRGWSPIKYSIHNPVCTACFYDGGRQDCNGSCGHAAIKIGARRWKGAGIRSVPSLPDHNGYHKGVLRRPYRLLGCLIPSKLK